MNKKMDQQLRIDTIGIVQYYADTHHNRYEPTDYRVLDEILSLDLISKDSYVLDYGCGMGRVGLYFSYKRNCHCLGIDYNYEMIQKAMENKETSKIKNVDFLCIDAMEYRLDEAINCFYFFNPFSLLILKKVMNHILTSFYEVNRELTFIFYYPNFETVSYLFSIDELICEEILDTNSIFHTNNELEKVYIFKCLPFD